MYTMKVYGAVEAMFPSFLWPSTEIQAGHFGEEITLSLLAKIEPRFHRRPPTEPSHYSYCLCYPRSRIKIDKQATKENKPVRKALNRRQQNSE